MLEIGFVFLVLLVGKWYLSLVHDILYYKFTGISETETISLHHKNQGEIKRNGKETEKLSCIKFSFPGKATKICAIFLMVLTFTNS